MKRLTRKMPGGRYGLVEGKELGTVRNNRAVIDRLGAYEDTGLVPEEIAGVQKEIGTVLALECELRDHGNMWSFDHLRELIQAEKAGRLVVLPCKVGDTLWLTENPWTERELKKPVAVSVTAVKSYAWGIFVALLFDEKQFSGSKDYAYRCIGKTVFFTREEAEAALKGGND